MRRKDRIDRILDNIYLAEKDVHSLRSYFSFQKSDWKYRTDAQKQITDEANECYSYVDYMIYQLRQDLNDIKNYFDLAEKYNRHPDHFSAPPDPPARYRKDPPDFPDFY